MPAIADGDRVEPVVDATAEDDELSELLDRALALRHWEPIRDLAVEHPALLTERAGLALQRRASRARDIQDEGRAMEIELMRNAFKAWSALPLEVLQLTDVQQPVPDGVYAAKELAERFATSADPRHAVEAARAWLAVIGDPGFDGLPMGARAAYLFECYEASDSAYGSTAMPEFLDDLQAVIQRLINSPIPATAQSGAYVRWGKFLALQFWAHLDPADARKALTAFRRSYESAPWNTEEHSLNVCHYAGWIRKLARPAPVSMPPLGDFASSASLDQAVELLRAELTTAPAIAVGAVAYELALALEAQSEGSDGRTLTEALELARRAVSENMTSPHDRLGARAAVATLGAKVHAVAGNGDPQDISRQFRDVVAESVDVSLQFAINLAGSWGHWALDQSRPLEAIDAFEVAIRASEEILLEQVTWKDVEIWLDYRQSVTTDLALALALTNQRERAVEVLESGRRGWLSEGLHDIHEERRILAQTHPGLTARLDQARAELRSAVLLRSDTDPGMTRESVRSARASVDAIVTEIWKFVPSYGRPWTYNQIANTVTDQPLVYVAASTTSGLVLLIDPQTKEVSCELLGDLRSEIVLQKVAPYLDATATGDDLIAAPTADLREALESTADWLGQVLLEPLLRMKKEALAFRVVPVGPIGLLPLHLARRPNTSSPTGYRYLLDDISVSIMPSATFLLRQSAEASQPSRAFSAAVIESKDKSLGGAKAEAIMIAATFGSGSRPLTPSEMTRDSVMECLRAADVAHISCHGIADLLRPLESALLIGISDRITVRDLLADPGFSLRLAVLSACQSAMSGSRLPDEAISLPTALLKAGAGAVIGSLWAVPDAPTALLMSRFYELWQLEGHDPPEALRLAQIWLRDSPNSEHADRFPSVDLRKVRLLPESVEDWGRRRGYAHPDNWAGFVFTGVWTTGQPSD